MRPFLQFPELFFLAPLLVPVLLRIVAAASFGYIAFIQYKRRSEISAMRLPLIGKWRLWLVWVAIVLEASMGLSLLVGYYAQVVALLGFVLCVKHYVYAKKYARAIPLCRADYIYLAVICLALIFMGAGAFAMDLPL